MKKLLSAALIIMLAGSGLGKPSQDSGIEYVSSLLWSKAYDAKIVGEHAFCAFLNGLVILDVSDKRKPAFVSSLYLGGGFAIDTKDGLAFVAAGVKGLQIVDVSDINAPFLKGFFDTPGEAKDIVVAGNHAFVADGPSGLQVVDISKPSSPRLAASLDTPGTAGGVIISGDHAYVADGSSGLQIINISDPSKPKLEGAYDTPGTAESVAVSGNIAYVADGSPGLQVINIAHPSSPELISSFMTSGYARGVTVRENHAFVGNLYDGAFQIIDISDPKALNVLATRKYTMYNEAWDVTVSGDYAYVVDYFAGIHLLRITDPSSPVTTGLYYTPGSIIVAAAIGKTIYAVGDLSGLQVIDIANASVPKVVASSGRMRGIHGLTAGGGYVYITDRWSLKTYSVGDPSKTNIIHTLRTPGVARTVVARGNLVYMTSDHSGFHVIDVSEPKAPEIVGSYPMPGFAYGLAVSGDYVYVANSDTGFHIIDISYPMSPDLVSSLKTPGMAYGVAVKGTYAYVADGDSGLQIIDISDPKAPKIVGSCPIEGFSNGVALKGKYAYVSDEIRGLKKIDISNPKDPRLVGQFDTPGEAAGVTVCGEYLVLSDSFSLLILR